MRKILFIIGLSSIGFGQTVYLRDSAPQAAIIDSVSNATPIVVTTKQPHGFDSTCGISTTCYVTVWGVSTGTGVSPANGIRLIHYVDSTHVSLYDLSNVAVASVVNGYGGNWFNGGTVLGGGGGAWIGLVHPYTLGAQPLGWFDGPTGHTMRRLSWLPTSIVVTGGSGGSCGSVACGVTVVSGYDPTTEPIPLEVGDKVSFTGTGTALDTGGVSTPQFGYTVATVSSTGFTTTPIVIPGLTTGSKSGLNNHCGPSAVPNDLRGGTQACERFSLMAIDSGSNNVGWWNGMTYNQYINGYLTSPDYKINWDGGTKYANHEIIDFYAMAAIRFIVDPTSDLFLEQCIYAMDRLERVAGVNFTLNQGANSSQPNSDLSYQDGVVSASIIYAIASPYYTASKKTIFLNKLYNNVEDPYNPIASTANADTANTLATHTWILASGNVAAGTNDATHVTLASSADCKTNSIVMLNNGYPITYANNSYGYVTGCVGAVATIGAGWKLGYFGGTNPGYPADLTAVMSATVTGGSMTCVGTVGQTGVMQNNDSFGYVTMTGTNTYGNTITITYPGSINGTWHGNSAAGGSAVCTGNATVSMTQGVSYVVMDTGSFSNATAGASTTVTFGNTTNVNATISIGDALIPSLGWYTGQYSSVECYVTAVSTTSLTCTWGLAAGITAGTPIMLWKAPQWTTGDVGYLWGAMHSVIGLGYSPAVLGGSGGAVVGSGATGVIGPGANIASASLQGWVSMDFAAAADDARAIRDLSRIQSYNHDFVLAPGMAYVTGPQQDGPGYTNDTDVNIMEGLVWNLNVSLANATPSYPSMNGDWNKAQGIWQMYSTMPNDGYYVNWGYNGGYTIGGSLTGQGIAVNPLIGQFGNTTIGKMYRSWMDSNLLWGYNAMQTDFAAWQFLHNPGNVKTTDYKTQPLQYAFNTSSVALCQSFAGGTLNGNCTGLTKDWFVSRTGWTPASNVSVMTFGSGTFLNGYDSPPVVTSLFKGDVGLPLLGCDTSVPGSSGQYRDNSQGCDAVHFGDNSVGTFTQFKIGFGGNQSGNTGAAPLSRWSCSNLYSLGCNYGNQNNDYVYGMVNSALAYNATGLGTTPSYVNNYRLHTKKSTDDEFVVMATDVLVSSPIAITQHLQYPQNGTTPGYPPVASGTTNCVGTCNVSKIIKSTETGVGTAIYGLQTFVTSPSSITLTDDCVGKAGGQCSPSDTYVGGVGYTHRYSVSAGSLGSSQTSFTMFACSKVMNGLSDTTFNTAALAPDSNFAGCHVCGSVSCLGYVEALNNTTQSTITPFTVTTGLTKNTYVIGGLTPGTYTPYVDNVPVTSCNHGVVPCTVSVNDNSLEFESNVSGTVTISLGPVVVPIGGSSGKNAKVGGGVVIK